MTILRKSISLEQLLRVPETPLRFFFLFVHLLLRLAGTLFHAANTSHATRTRKQKEISFVSRRRLEIKWKPGGSAPVILIPCFFLALDRNSVGDAVTDPSVGRASKITSNLERICALSVCLGDILHRLQGP